MFSAWENIMQQDTFIRWITGSYGRAYLSATVSKYIQWQTYEPLPKGAFFCGKSVGVRRDTERAAAFLWGNGYMPGNIFVQDRLWLMPKQKRFIKVDWNWVGAEQPIHHKAHGRVCIECRTQKPLTADFWHRDSKGKDGYKTICKSCRCKQEAQRMHEVRAA